MDQHGAPSVGKVLRPGLTARNCTQADGQATVLYTLPLVSSPWTAVQQRGIAVSARPWSLIEVVSSFTLLNGEQSACGQECSESMASSPYLECGPPKHLPCVPGRINQFFYFIYLPRPLKYSPGEDLVQFGGGGGQRGWHKPLQFGAL